jgi:hypothetical protein
MKMNLRTLKDTPPWDWPEGTGKTLLDILRDDRPSESDLLLATELAGDFTVINDELVDALLSILRRGDKPEAVRGGAAISLGPVLEHVDTEGFDDPDDPSITERTFHRIQESLRKLYMDTNVPRDVRRRILEASVRAPRTGTGMRSAPPTRATTRSGGSPPSSACASFADSVRRFSKR